VAFTVAVEDAEISAPLATVCQALADHFWRTSAELPIFGRTDTVRVRPFAATLTLLATVTLPVAVGNPVEVACSAADFVGTKATYQPPVEKVVVVPTATHLPASYRHSVTVRPPAGCPLTFSRPVTATFPL